MRKIILYILLLTLSLPAWADTAKESAFDRIMRTGVIRCGYYVFPPATYRDPNNGKLSGLSVDMMNEIGHRAGLKIEWTEEVNFTNWIPGLQSNRFDIACTPMWPDIPQGRAAAFTRPMFYAGLYPAVRESDARFKSGDTLQLNSETITFAVPVGDAPESLVKIHFPKAKLLPETGDTNIAQFALDVLTKKADAFVIDYNGVYQFNKTNPEKLKLIGLDHPLKWQPFTLAAGRQEMILKDYLDNAINDLINDGTMDAMLTKWEGDPGKTFLRISDPAKLPQESRNK